MNRTVRNVTMSTLLFIYTIIYRVFIMKHLLRYGESITASFLILFLSFAILLLGFRKNKSNMLKKNIVFLTCIEISIFFGISYFLGFFVGFLKNAYSLELPTMFNNIFAPIIIIICVELFRYIFIGANKDKKESIIIITILLILFEISVTTRRLDFTDFENLFKIVTSSILPIIFKNCVLSYLTFYTGYKPALIYRLIMDIYIYVMPIFPDLGDYLNSIIGICMPILLYILASRVIEHYYNLEERVNYKTGISWFDIPIVVIIIIFVALISQYFPYYILGIGSSSMSPAINKGDAVLVHKVNNAKEIEKNDIVVFKQDNKRIVHRLIEIKKEDGKRYYVTKGDANNSPDIRLLESKDIIGVVNFKIPWISYPSIWFTELMKK